MEDLKKIREKITDIDNRMAGLFEARMQQVAKVAEYKRQNGLPIYDPKREAEVIAKGEARVENSEIKPYYGQFLQDMMAVSRRYQARLLEGLRRTAGPRARLHILRQAASSRWGRRSLTADSRRLMRRWSAVRATVRCCRSRTALQAMWTRLTI